MANFFECFHEPGYRKLYELGIVQIGYIMTIWYMFGVLKGAVIGIILAYVFYTVMDYFGYQSVSGMDAMSATEIRPENIRNCGAYMRIGKITAEDLRDKYFYRKGILNIRRLRQIWIDICGLWFLKDISPEVARNQVKKIPDDIKTQEDINAYMAKLMAKDLDRSKPLWEIHVKEDYDENTSIVFMLVHHLLSDGMGIITMMTFLNDDVPEDALINHRKIPFFFYYIMPILYLPIGIIKYIQLGLKCQGDPNMVPFSLKNDRQSGVKTYLESKTYELDDLRKCYKQYKGVKLNDYMYACISAAYSKYFTKLGILKQTYFTASVPVNMKPLPSSIEEVQFNNNVSFCLANVPISTDMESTMKSLRSYFDTGFSLANLRFGQWAATGTGSLPVSILRLFVMDNTENMDTCISNTPGPQKPIYFCDQKVLDLGGIGPNIGKTGITILISSYCSKIKLQILADKNLEMDPSVFLNHLEAQLDEAILSIK